MKNGYEEAQKIEETINQFLKDDPITADNGMEWWRFARTINTTMSMIEEESRNKIDEMTEDIASERNRLRTAHGNILFVQDAIYYDTANKQKVVFKEFMRDRGFALVYPVGKKDPQDSYAIHPIYLKIPISQSDSQKFSNSILRKRFIILDD